MSAIKRSFTAVLALPLLLALPACGDKKPKEAAKDAKPKVEKVENKPLSTLFTGKKVTIPAPYGALKFGMTKAEAKAAMPELPEDGTIKLPEYEGTWFNTGVDSDSNELSRVYFTAPRAEVLKLMTAQWGPPQTAKDLSEEVLWWFNPEAELRASLSAASSDGEAHVEFTHYWPATKFLGEGPGLGFEKPAPLLGLSLADYNAKYGEWIERLSEADAAKRQAEIKKFAGAKAGALMGKPSASMDLNFPPLEWGKYWTRVYPSWSEKGTIDRYWFSVEFESHPEAKAELMALMVKKWGEPKEEEKYGDKLLVFSEEPFITVEEDTISKAWKVYVEPKRD